MAIFMGRCGTPTGKTTGRVLGSLRRALGTIRDWGRSCRVDAYKMAAGGRAGGT